MILVMGLIKNSPAVERKPEQPSAEKFLEMSLTEVKELSRQLAEQNQSAVKENSGLEEDVRQLEQDLQSIEQNKQRFAEEIVHIDEQLKELTLKGQALDASQAELAEEFQQQKTQRAQLQEDLSKLRESVR